MRIPYSRDDEDFDRELAWREKEAAVRADFAFDEWCHGCGEAWDDCVCEEAKA